MLKKSIALILSICMLLSLCACGSNDKKEKTKKDDEKTESINEDFDSSEDYVDEDDDFDTDKTTNPSTPEEKLSSTCSMVLCTGTENGNTYELVANQIDGYPDSTFEFGVIKNNQWLVPMGSDCPFIDDNGWWLYAEGSNEPCDFRYIESGCFYYNEKGMYSPKILYKPETGISVEVNRLYKNPNAEYGRDPYSINDQSEIIVRLQDPDNKFPLVYINMNTGERKTLPLDSYDATTIGEISDGLFFATFDEIMEDPKHGFYDIEGNLVIDLSTYAVRDLKLRKFVDGKYTFRVINNSNVFFDITIDTTGKVLSQEKVEN